MIDICDLTYSSVIFISELWSLSWHKPDFGRDIMTLWLSPANRCLSTFSVWSRKEILTNKSWNMTIIARNVLQTHFMCGSSDPISRISAAITEHILLRLVLMCHVLESNFVIQILCGSSYRVMALRGIVRGSMRGLEEVNDCAIHISSCHTKLIDLGRYMACVTGHILFVKVYLAVTGTQ